MASDLLLPIRIEQQYPWGYRPYTPMSSHPLVLVKSSIAFKVPIRGPLFPEKTFMQAWVYRDDFFSCNFLA